MTVIEVEWVHPGGASEMMTEKGEKGDKPEFYTRKRVEIRIKKVSRDLFHKRARKYPNQSFVVLLLLHWILKLEEQHEIREN